PLPANMRLLAELCAVLGDGLTREDVTGAQARLEPGLELSPLASVDAGVGLARLARAGLLVPGPEGRHDFRHPLLREALEAGIPPRRRRLLHLAALGALPEVPDAARAWRRARHAAGAGERDVAFDAWLRLAEGARLAHRAVEAELGYSAALEQLAPDDARRERALAGRGMARYRSHRFREAREDLHSAAGLALSRGASDTAAELLLEEATVLDWVEDWDGSRVLTERALELGQASADPRLGARLELGRGRLAVRGGQWDEAALRLRRSAEDAARVGEPEVRAISLVLLGAVLTVTDRLDDAEATFEAALAHCAATGDRLHLAIAYNNRGLLWQKRQAVARAIEDLRHNRAIARELGHPQIERWSTFNLGEFLHFLGDWDEAWTLAERAHELGQRFFREHPVAQDALLLARIAASRGDFTAAARQLAWIDERCGASLAPPSSVQHRMVRQVLAEASGLFVPEAWDALVADARRDCSPDELLELLVQATSQARKAGAGEAAGRYLDEARSLAERSPLWWPRLRAFDPAR
ncbi:MAG TPA: hypothetical protein VK420_15990, partial [Longimicrobium sp.]|nr:hypothetical protein [Longimicrobium sp.]